MFVLAGIPICALRAQGPLPSEPVPAALDAEPPLSSAEERVVRALRATREKPPPPTDTLRKTLAASAGESVECLLTILETRLVPALDGPRVQHLSVLQEELVQGALLHVGRGTVMPLVEQHLAISKSAATRAGAITVLGLFGQFSDMQRMVGLATTPEERLCDANTSKALTHAVRAILQRDVRAYDELHRSTNWQPTEVVAAVVAGVGAARSPRGIAFFSELLATRADVAAEVVAQIQLTGPSFIRELDIECGSRALLYIDTSRPSLTRAAVLAVGTLEDERAMSTLIALLDDESEGMRADVLWSLKRISCVDLPAQREEWSRWYEAEDAWYAKEGERVLDALHDQDRGRCAAAIRACMTHRLFRHELSPALSELVGSDDPEVSILASQALGELASPVAIPSLTATLDFEDTRVANASREALARIVARYPRLAPSGG